MKTIRIQNMFIIAGAMVIGMVNYGHATFSSVDYDVGGKLYLNGEQNAPSSSGNVGSNGGTDAWVDIYASGNAFFGEGYGTIKPASGATLTDLTFTPQSDSQFCGFSFTAQLDVQGNATSPITLVVTSQSGENTTFTFTGYQNASKTYGVIGSGGDTIKSVKISADSFDQVKLNNFSLCNNAAVPEPSTVIAGALLLLPIGMSTFRILRKKRTV